MGDSEDQIVDVTESSLLEAGDKQCQFCSSESSKYLCPRCGVRYCSVPCYRNPLHLMCSEEFFKQCIQEELNSTASSSEGRKQMMEALQKMHEEGIEEDELLDSDDEDEDLATRLENIDLNNAEAVWSLLTHAERAEFESLVASGDVEKILPVLTPWWIKKESPLIEEISPAASGSSNSAQYPALIPNIPLFYVICSVKPSPCIDFNMINVLASYTFTWRLYNGEPEQNGVEAGSCLMRLSDNLNNNANFSERAVAVEAVVMKAIDIMQSSPEDTHLIKSDVNDILDSKEFVLYALSGAFNILSQAKNALKAIKKSSSSTTSGSATKQSFSARFPPSSTGASSPDFTLTKSSLNAALKKLEYFMSWVKAYYTKEPKPSTS